MNKAKIAFFFTWLNNRRVIKREVGQIIFHGEEITLFTEKLLGHVISHGGVLAAQYQPRKSNTYQPLIDIRIEQLIFLLER
jgi:hypothetical protein